MLKPEASLHLLEELELALLRGVSHLAETLDRLEARRMLTTRDNLALVLHQVLSGQATGGMLRRAVPNHALGTNRYLRTAHHVLATNTHVVAARVVAAHVIAAILASVIATILTSVTTTSLHRSSTTHRLRSHFITRAVSGIHFYTVYKQITHPCSRVRTWPSPLRRVHANAFQVPFQPP